MLILDSETNSEDLENLLTNVYITMNCRFIIAQPIDLGYTWSEVYRISINSTLQIIPHGSWTISEGFSKTYSFLLPSIYQNRKNFNGLPFRMGVFEVSLELIS